MTTRQANRFRDFLTGYNWVLKFAKTETCVKIFFIINILELTAKVTEV